MTRIHVTFVCGAILTLGCTSVPRGADVLLPGSTTLATTHFRDTTIGYRMFAAASGSDSVEQNMGAMRDAMVLTTANGAPALLIVQASADPGKSAVDSILVRRDGLAPISEHIHLDAQTISIDYDGARVRRTDTRRDSLPRQVDHTYGVQVFNFAELDKLVRALPLRAGYRAILPLYSEADDAMEMDTVQVDGRDSTGVWNVRLVDKKTVSHYGIDGTTRAMTRHVFEYIDGSAFFRTAQEPRLDSRTARARKGP